MSVREEEDRPGTSSMGRSLGVAAIAVGVGVGAAMYYFLSKRTETPNQEGSTTTWNCDDWNFRQRSWEAEDCTICFDLMLHYQDVQSLPCTHNFHKECIVRWLLEQDTCPICRLSIYSG